MPNSSERFPSCNMFNRNRFSCKVSFTMGNRSTSSKRISLEIGIIAFIREHAEERRLQTHCKAVPTRLHFLEAIPRGTLRA